MFNPKLMHMLLLILFVSGATIKDAQAQLNMAVGVKAGTAGYGGEFVTSLHDKVNARLTGSFFSYSNNGNYDEEDISIAYDVTGDLTSIGGVVDYYPFTRFLKLSAGLFYHDFLIDGGAVPTESYTIEDKEFAPEKMGSLSALIDYESKIIPYFGLGLGNPVGAGSKFKVNFELGALYTNSPRVTMSGEGMIAPTADQGPEIQDGLRDFKFYPILNFGLSYRFTILKSNEFENE